MAAEHCTVRRLLKHLKYRRNIAVFGESLVGKNWQSRECAEILESFHAP